MDPTRPSAPADPFSAERSQLSLLRIPRSRPASNLASASRLAGTTATIILLMPHVGSPWGMFGSRLVEVGWGVSVAVATVWVAARLPARYWP
jgi:hypothetical protein